MSKRKPETLKPAVSDELSAKLPLDVAIANRLIRDIIALRYPPGSWLREQEIAERFGVSRYPVREALRHVTKQGYLEMHPWRGAQLVELSEDTTVHIFDMLEALYGVVARQSTDYERLLREVSSERVAKHLGIEDPGRVQRYELPNLAAVNFVVRGILTNSLRVDAQGKTLGQALLEMPLDESN